MNLHGETIPTRANPEFEAALEAHFAQEREATLLTLSRLVGFRSVSSSADDSELRACAHFIADRLESAGLVATVVESSSHPIVFAHRGSDPRHPTVLLYSHYDVQSAEPLAAWNFPPFELTRDGPSLYGRGTADSKGHVVMHLTALEAVLALEPDLPLNVRVIFEGSEEIGSPGLAEFAVERLEELASDVVIASDNATWGAGEPAIVYGLRGLIVFEVTLALMEHEVHSGAFGGIAPNAANLLIQSLGRLWDRDGGIAIPGFYDAVRPADANERAHLASLAPPDSYYQGLLGLDTFAGDPQRSVLERLWTLPTLDVNGITAGYQGPGVKTIVPPSASAKISCRLVPDQDPNLIGEQIAQVLSSGLPPGSRLTIKPLYRADPFVADRTEPVFEVASQALQRAFGSPVRFVRTGGSNPAEAILARELGAPCVVFGISQDDASEHGPNERLQAANLWHGQFAAALLLQMLAAEAPRWRRSATDGDKPAATT
ncbi:MAG TPA: M20/M25/M40 family metallo-hydrolase [Patescibacteria group bacterium]|nr:M20/M25/M40 family metallo-hydrolase [Patescibacteria group bacterium]